MRNRKELPHMAKILKKFDINKIVDYCRHNGYTDYTQFNDIKYSSDSNHQSFLLANNFSKNKFFKEEIADNLEGEKYKQLYFTDIDPSLRKSSSEKLVDTGKSIFSRSKRLNPNHHSYIPESDELNYTLRNHHVKDIFEQILNDFNAQVTRVRLAVLMPGFAIKPHIDYDPSYITRYHLPIITNNDVTFGWKRGQEIIEDKMLADGSVYFFNGGLLHWVANNGINPRLHLIIDTHGQQDLILHED